MKKIAIIGGTGMLGIPVVIELLNAGFEVTALVRDPDKAKHLLPERASLVRADVRDVESLKAGLQGQDGVYLSLAVSPGDGPAAFHTEDEGLANIQEAARAAQVTRVAYLSAINR